MQKRGRAALGFARGANTRHLRAQAALEQMILLGMSILLVSVIFAFSLNYAYDSVRAAQAKDTADKIAKASDSVYSLGPGSKTTISIYMPKDVRFVNITNNTVQIRFGLSSGDTDVFSKSQAVMVGSVQTTSDLQQIVLSADSSGRVIIGSQLLTCSPGSISRTLPQNSSGNDTLSVSDTATYALSGISANLSGSLGDILTITQPNGTLASGGASAINLSYSVALAKATGTYSGTITVNGSNSSLCTSTITVFVTRSGGADSLGPNASSLSITPSSPNAYMAITLNATGSDVSTGNSSIASCQEQLDSSGIWGQMSATDGAYNSPTEAVSYYLGYVSSGNHTVSVRCIDSAGNTGVATPLNFTVAAGNSSNSSGSGTGPIVTNITITPALPNTTAVITVNATANDSSGVSMCQFAVDGFNWANLNSTTGTYNLTVQNITGTVGVISTGGNHSLGIFCNDSLGNLGSVYALNFTVNGTSNASGAGTGPIVTNITITPALPNTTTIITVNATANDSSNVSMCQFAVDGFNWANLNSTTGTYNLSVQNVNGTVGIISTGGNHSLGIFCNDSLGRIGSVYALNFTVNGTAIIASGPVDIAFVVANNAAPTSDEQGWAGFIATHKSGLGFNWSIAVINESNVTGGTVNLSNYRMIALANSLSSDTTYYQMLNASKAKHFVLLFGQAAQYGVLNLGVGPAATSSTATTLIVPRVTNYISTGYSIGTSVTIGISATQYAFANTSMVNTTNLFSTSTAANMVVGYRNDTANRVMVFGVMLPYNLTTTNGSVIATRAIDYALNASLPGGS